MPYRRKDSPHYWISWTDQAGRRRCESSGTSDHQQAKALEQERRAAGVRQRSPHAAHTVGDVLHQYLTDKPSERAAWAAARLLEQWQHTALIDITPRMVTQYKASRAVADGTLAKELGTLRAAIRHCRREHGWQVPDPTEGRIPSDQSDRMRWLTPREACRLVRAARESRQAPYLADLILLALHAGLRQGELLGLTWDRVDLRRWELHFLEPSQQKSRRVDVVPLNQHARDALLRRAAWRAEHCPSCRYVFARMRRGQCKPIDSIRTGWSVACRKAGLEDVHPHDLRRTCASWLVQAGVPLRAVAAILRHRDIRTTMRYAYLSPDDARAGVQVLERSVGRSIGGRGADKISHLQSRSATRLNVSD